MVKIFNNGTTRGMPILRTMVTKEKEFNPRAFDVFGPKIVAMRHGFRDEALESRLITEEMGTRPLHQDIPISLPATYAEEARRLRNMLLMYRFRTFHEARIEANDASASLSSRSNQMLLPLLALTDDENTRAHLLSKASETDARMRAHRSQTHEGLLLPILQKTCERRTGNFNPAARGRIRARARRVA
jgi:hypothetical protein